jgi:2-amino-4-hydroxy-6-hydroxymethyldihydropteridine diphosphokinase
LLWGDEVIDTLELTVPHPALHERDFVLVPLADLAADVVHPVTGQTIADHLDAIEVVDVVLFDATRSRSGNP